ncbi:Uncharacterised protein [Yersinia enterocolitica]|uniref:Uncharacterized protein n=1 Tax=Yersinia enterocolitica TaxID=630 RepID=A0A9P1PWK4_YEREN|nr:Uncharacterised protein [Yersinia enterocolitica]CNF03400.1 Uncharacterised protein [Yersinia enterocolitica]CNF88544.1 Uncharacterised protein [Yersinia enterocolitica]CNG54956.1 Uncharacterised protein [Yersinia enterocolitica]CNL05431.1 Uncharacterised protein [Yersinia enterocolitica]
MGKALYELRKQYAMKWKMGKYLIDGCCFH